MRYCYIYNRYDIAFILDDSYYVANVGDSRAVTSRMNGKIVEPLTNDHKPSNKSEAERISKAGGSVYQYNFINI